MVLVLRVLLTRNRYIFKEFYKTDFNIRKVSKGAFTKARAHLNPESFKYLNTIICRNFYRDEAYKRWYNKRLLAADGSRIMLPNHEWSFY